MLIEYIVAYAYGFHLPRYTSISAQVLSKVSWNTSFLDIQRWQFSSSGMPQTRMKNSSISVLTVNPSSFKIRNFSSQLCKVHAHKQVNSFYINFNFPTKNSKSCCHYAECVFNCSACP